MTAAAHAVALFAQFVDQPLDARGAYVFTHPVLLANAALSAIRATEPAGAPALALGDLAAFRAQLDAGQAFPLGDSPIERAGEALFRGEISLNEALRRARSADVVSPIAYPYVRTLAQAALRMAADRPRDALDMLTLILAATEAADADAEALLARTRAGMDYITAATPVLIDVPDGRVYARAMSVGQWLQTRAERLTLWPPGELAFRLGVLNLDPYMMGGDTVNYARSLDAWHNRLTARLGPAAAKIPVEDLALPTPAQALALAVGYLSDAAATQTGASLPAAQKALGQAIALQSAIGPGATASADAVARARLTLPQSLAHGNPVLGLVALSQAIDDGSIAPADAERRLAELRAPAELLERSGAERAVQAVLDALLLFARLQSARGLPFAQTYAALVASAGDAPARRLFFQRELQLFACSAGEAQTDAPAELVAMIEPAQRAGRETDILAAIDQLTTAEPQFAAAYADALQYLQFVCYGGLAKNAVNAAAWPDAIVHNGRALAYCLRLGFPDEADYHASRIDDLAGHAEPGVDTAVAIVVLECALSFEAMSGDRALRFVRSICTKAVTGMVSRGTIDTRVYGSLMLAATGSRLGTTLGMGAAIDPTHDPTARSLLERIAELDRAIGPQFQIINGEEALLASFVETADREDGAEPAERLRNLQRAFDVRIDSLFAARAAQKRPDALTLDGLRAALDEHTVLLHYFLGSTPDGRIATNVLLVTRDDEPQAATIAEAFPAGLVGVNLGNGLHGFMPPLGFAIQERRAQVCSEPGVRLVDPAAGAGLVADLRRFLGPFVERLAELHAAGKTALTIVPHGPLHFYPWSLLGGAEHPLAVDWTITVAPSLGFLQRRDTVDTPRAAPLKTERTVIGLAFGAPNRLKLPPIPASADEARTIAATLGVTPILDAAATKSTVVAALRRSRIAHISTHGRHAVVAPGFQMMLCADDGGDDAGRLYAHELLGEDFRGLELLTLSACETALGRYDLGDNLRGLPAAFFLAGVRTIVGSLWPVRAGATALFFPAFYVAIQAGARHRDAFATALAKTRAAFPQLRDWGAFYLMGGCA